MNHARVDLGDLSLAEGAHLLLKRALRRLEPREVIEVDARAPDAAIGLRSWAREEGHGFRKNGGPGRFLIEKGTAEDDRWAKAETTGHPDARLPGGVLSEPPARWGLAARGSTLEAGMPEFDFRLTRKSEVWADDALRLYQQALAAQWDPNTEVDWQADFDMPDDVEDAVVQIMTYLIENETAALVVPSRFVAQLHPHFREVMQLLAIQAADEARHIEVFTRRAVLRSDRLGLSTVGGQLSLKTLVDEPDFAVASFLLSVMGEGTFVTLLRFLERHAPDPVTRRVTQLAAQDETRHVAFGVAHLAESVRVDPRLLDRLQRSVERRHDTLRQTSGLNREVFDALILVAAGGWETERLREGSRRVTALIRDMDATRRGHLLRIGFTKEQAEELSSLHTRNFM